MTDFKPMLAVNCLDLNDLALPVYMTPKYDGWRCCIGPGGVPMTRKLLPIPNLHVRKVLTAAQLPVGLDGELTLADPTGPFQDVQSAMASVLGKPDFLYNVFDWAKVPGGYMARVSALADWARRHKGMPPEWLRLVVPRRAATLHHVRDKLALWLAEGYEGAIVRSGDGPYKYGRSTLREGYMLKLKPFLDDEAVIIGFAEEQRNLNKAEKDAMGHTKRSSSKANKVGKGTLGKFVCRYKGQEFSVGTGLTADQRVTYWQGRGELLGKTLKFKHQKPSSADKTRNNKPRSPVFLGFRHPADMP